MPEEELLEAVSFLAKRCVNFNADVVVAIERGGTPLGLFISSYLKLPLKKIKVSYYDGENKNSEPRVNLNDFDGSLYKNPIFIDDLVDSGSTMRFIKEKYKNAKFVTIYSDLYNNSDLYYDIKPKDAWVVFPWDLDNDGFNPVFLENKWWKNFKRNYMYV
jgi:xanthine phosphoribosyltransferase